MPPSYNIIEAANRMDFDAVVEIASTDPKAVHRIGHELENALHVLVVGGILKTRVIAEYLLKHTEISVHHRDRFGRDPLDLAIEMQDDEAVQLLYPYWLAQSKRLENSVARGLSIVKHDDPAPG